MTSSPADDISVPLFDHAAGALDGGTYYGTPLVDESRIVSPGEAGRAFNPIVWAEFRRWRARPFTYFAFVVAIVGGISYLHFSRTGFIPWLTRMGILPAAAGPGYMIARYLQYMLELIVRPSTLVPFLLTWRALVSFRDGGLYQPFRTTFLTPNHFLWGIVAIPFLLGAVVLVGYTGIVLTPGMLTRYFGAPPDFRDVQPYWMVFSILFEGSVNGMLICFVALYFGLRGNARLSALVPVFLSLLLIQSLHSLLYLFADEVQEWLSSPASGLSTIGRWLPVGDASIQKLELSIRNAAPHIRALWSYFAAALPKMLFAFLFWRGCVRLLRRGED